MSSLAIELTPAQADLLEKRANELGLRPTELALAAIQDLLSEPDGAFDEATSRVLEKNAELYRRLA